ncbi:hypothetical protein RJ498_003536 [Pluralibacter gergoviae]
MIAFYVEGVYYANLFSRIVNALSENEKKDFIFYCRNEGVSCFINSMISEPRVNCIADIGIIPSYSQFYAEHPHLADKMKKAYESSFEYILGGRDDNLCWYAMYSNFIYLIHQINEYPIHKFIMCSGCGIGAKAAGLVCELHGIDKQYVELANLPGKIFVDALGTNAHSRLASEPELLDKYPKVMDSLHKEWMNSYQKTKSVPPPQAAGNPLSSRIAELSQDKVLNKKIEYIFAPLQVSNDAQLWMHSDYKNADLIRYGMTLAENSGAQLVVKIHPAECSTDEVEMIRTLNQRYPFKISVEPTTELLNSACAVITINSTVGLEAMLYNKPLSILGRTYYKEFNSERLKKYIHHYLFDGIEFFSSQRINRTNALAFLNYR